MKAVFMNGNRKLTMKVNKMNEDGSVILIDGTRLEKHEIIEIKNE